MLEPVAKEWDASEGAELTTDEVLRSGEEQLRSSRDVLTMIDEALTKSREVLEGNTRRELTDRRQDGAGLMDPFGVPGREDANRG